jgi:hypothetical protein
MSNSVHKLINRHRESGAALLIAIFALMLISVVAIALVVSQGTDSALAGNYRTSTSAYYAALAGLEEGRGRLLGRNPNFIGKTVNNFVPTQGTPLDVHTVLYVVNPASSETVNPTDSTSAYADKEYDTEFTSWHLSGATVLPYVQSVWPVNGNPGPAYKWVRINAVTEQALQLDVDNQHANDGLNPLYYDGFGLNRTYSGAQALEVTALAVLPSGGTRLLQYVVTPVTLSLPFPAALTLIGSSGNNVQFTGPGTPSFFVNWNDQFTVGSCAPGSVPVYAIGYANGSDASGITAAPAGKYEGTAGSSTVPSVADVSAQLPASFQTLSGINSVVQNIIQNADVSLSPVAPATSVPGASLPSAMSITNPMTIAVNGDLDLTNWHGIGYGLLLVTGTLTYDPDATWNGIVLVIGKGNFVSTKPGSHEINGAMLIANTVTGNPPTAFGPASFSQTGGDPSGYGINFSSCWLKVAQQPTTYKVLSFREIPTN